MNFSLQNCYSQYELQIESDLWVYSPGEKKLPSHGFKIHISLTPFNIVENSKKIIPVLVHRGTSFKAARSEKVLEDLNYGKYGFTQVGKAYTIYPQSKIDFLELIEILKTILNKAQGPVIPSDFSVPDSQSLYYRYGVIDSSGLEQEGGVHLFTGPKGEVFKDERKPGRVMPPWISDPFLSENTSYQQFPKELVFTDILRQRAKGGVYRGIFYCLEQKKISPVIVKEARHLGEAESFSVDAVRRLLWQKDMINRLAGSGYVPKVVGSFTIDQNFYLIMSEIKSVSLAQMKHDGHRFKKKESATIIFQIEKMIKLLHGQDIFVCDLSPDNILVANERCFICDLECVWNEDFPINSKYGSMGYFPNTYKDQPLTQKMAKERDLFALEVIKSLIVTQLTENGDEK